MGDLVEEGLVNIFSLHMSEWSLRCLFINDFFNKYYLVI